MSLYYSEYHLKGVIIMTENITKTTSTPTDAVNKAYAAFEAARQAYDISIRGNDLHQAEKDLDALKKAEKQYAIDMQAKVFAECKASPDPLKAAIEKHYYSVVSHKVNRKDGAPIGVVEDSRIKRIDLVAFCQSPPNGLTLLSVAINFSRLRRLRI